ncbi:MAG: hypothetical protein ACOYXT_22230 [Bacteroidota bacterium]
MIKAAKSESELGSLIKKSVSRFRHERNSYNEDAYIMNMIVSLRVINTEGLPEATLNNIKNAIAIFRQHQAENRARIF